MNYRNLIPTENVIAKRHGSSLRILLVILITVLLATCSTSARRPSDINNNELFREFNILVSSEQDVMNAAYQTLSYLYPTSLIMPIGGNHSHGFVVDVESFDLDLFPFNQQLGFGPIWEPSYGYQVRLEFSETLGLTPLGSIVTGYRYTITTIPRGLNLFFIDDGADDIDVVFRSMLMKNRIPSLYVTRVV